MTIINHFLQLPRELHLMIFERLPARDRSIAALVSRAWAGLAGDPKLWREKLERDFAQITPANKQRYAFLSKEKTLSGLQISEAQYAEHVQQQKVQFADRTLTDVLYCFPKDWTHVPYGQALLDRFLRELKAAKGVLEINHPARELDKGTTIDHLETSQFSALMRAIKQWPETVSLGLRSVTLEKEQFAQVCQLVAKGKLCLLDLSDSSIAKEDITLLAESALGPESVLAHIRLDQASVVDGAFDKWRSNKWVFLEVI